MSINRSDGAFYLAPVLIPGGGVASPRPQTDTYTAAPPHYNQQNKQTKSGIQVHQAGNVLNYLNNPMTTCFM